MKVEILHNSEVASRAYQEVLQVVGGVASPVLGLATGSTPIELYGLMVDGCRQGVSYADVSTYNLDEYVGLTPTNTASYRYFMNSMLFDHIDIDINNTHVPYGLGDLAAQCNSYDDMLSNTHIHLQILGIGNNGHIAFNEPYTPWDSTTHIVELSASTIDANSRLFAHKADVPRQAITMGLASIMQAEKIVVLACGASKAQAVYDMVHGSEDARCPASILQQHDNVLVICDQEAGSLLDR